MFSRLSDLTFVPPTRNINSNCNGSFHRYNPYLNSPLTDDRMVLEKFQSDTFAKLETGELKNIQRLTSNDFLISAKQSQHYSSLLAHVEFIGPVDRLTGKVELRFYINEINKLVSYFVSQEMPFFVQQYSCWSSISPERTRQICGLNCRQLECGDSIITITEQRKTPAKTSRIPDYTQQSPIKCLVERYMNEKISSSKDNLILKKPTMK